MSVKYDVKTWDSIQKLLNSKGVPVGELTTVLSGIGQQSLPGKSCIAAHMIAHMKSKRG